MGSSMQECRAGRCRVKKVNGQKLEPAGVDKLSAIRQLRVEWNPRAIDDSIQITRRKYS